MSIATEATPHRRGRPLADLVGAGPIREYTRVTTTNPAPLHSCRRCRAGSESAAGSYDPQRCRPCWCPPRTDSSPSERGSE
jgi:hypothetical protein